MSFDEHTFYFVRYPLGGGGAHLVNLISLSTLISKPVDNVSANTYFAYLKDTIYNNNKKNAHGYWQFIISDQEKWKTALKKIDYTLHGSVYAGHAASFFWANDILKCLKNKKYISLTFNTESSEKLLLDREYRLFCSQTLKNSYYKNEIKYFYNQEFISENHWCNDDINLNIEISALFSDNVIPVISSINQKYNIKIPEDQAQELHSLWIKNIQ
jgi:hypothetical protein